MKPNLQFLELEPVVLCDHDFAVENASSGQLRAERLEQLGKVSIQRFRVAALNQDFVPIAKDQRAKPVPLRFEDPGFSRRQRVDSLREHRQHRRLNGEFHTSNAITATTPNQSKTHRESARSRSIVVLDRWRGRYSRCGGNLLSRNGRDRCISNLLSLGRIANERIGLLESRVMRWKARKLGIQTLCLRARRLLATKRPRIRMSITIDRDGRAGLA